MQRLPERIWSLRVVIVAGIVLTFLAVTGLSLLNSIHQRERMMLQQIREQAQRDIARLSRHAEHALTIKEDITEIASDPNLSAAALIDEAGIIRYANNFAWRNRAATEIIPAHELPLLKQAVETRLALTNEHVDDNHHFVIVMSFLSSADEQEIRNLNRGLIYLNYDLSDATWQAHAAAIHERLPDLLVIFVSTILLILFLHKKVTTPLSQLSTAVNAVANGQFLSVSIERAPIEIDELMRAFNIMSKRIATQVEELANHANHTQAIIDNMVDGLITIDHHGIVNAFNPAAERIFGYTSSEVIGQNVKILMPMPHRTNHDNYLQHYLDTGISHIIGVGIEVEGQHKSGHLFPMELSISEISRQGKPEYVGMVRDISERKQMERMKSEFVSTVSHELRTPLTSISGALGLIGGGVLGELPKPVQDMIGIAHKNSLHLSHLINDLLDMERLVAGKMHFDMRTQTLAPLLKQAMDANQAYGSERGVQLTLIDHAPDAEIQVDSLRFMQVLSNLLSNAIKYSPNNSRVEITTTLHDTRVRIGVTDQGSGVPAAFRDRIFQKFSQADASDTRQKGGTGLGLAITRELVERMGGQIGFESTEGQGAYFFFDLPVQIRKTAGTSDMTNTPADNKQH